MKCNACFTDNLNEAEYCKSCGKSLRKGSSRTMFVTIPVVLGIGIFLAAVIICSRKIIPLTEVHAVDESQFTAYKSNIIQFYDYNAGELVVKSETETGFSEYREKMSAPESIEEGKDCALVKSGNKQYFVTANKTFKLKKPAEVQVARFAPACAYLNTDGQLKKCFEQKVTDVSENVIDFVLSTDGDLYYYRDDMNAEDEDGKTYDANSVYLDKKHVCTESTDDPLRELVCANSFGVYFQTVGGSLFVSPKDEAGKKYEFTDFEKLVLVSHSSIIAQKNDGKAYIWIENNDEVLLSEMPVTGVVAPDGYAFTGDVYGELIYTTDNGAIYADQEGNITLLPCKDGHSLKTAGNCTYLYWLDGENSLMRTDASGMHRDRVCGKNVSQYTISEDARTTYYISQEILYSYDGIESKALCKIKNALSLSVVYDNLIISFTDDGEHIKYCLFNGRLSSFTDKTPEYTAFTRFGAFYIINNEVFIYTEDGKFKTWEQMHPDEDDDAAASETASEADSKKKPKED